MNRLQEHECVNTAAQTRALRQQQFPVVILFVEVVFFKKVRGSNAHLRA